MPTRFHRAISSASCCASSRATTSPAEGSEPVPIGTKFTVAADELMAGWIKWADGKPAEHIMVRVADGKLPPKRSDLGDQDRSAWETDDHGEPRDPWQFTNYLPMMDENGELYTFTTSSARRPSDRRPIWHGAMGAHRRRHPDVYPIISLGVSSYQHQKKGIRPDQVPGVRSGWI